MENSIHQDKDATNYSQNNISFFCRKNIVNLISARSDSGFIVQTARYASGQRVQHVNIGRYSSFFGGSSSPHEPILSVVSDSDLINKEGFFKSTGISHTPDVHVEIGIDKVIFEGGSVGVISIFREENVYDGTVD